MHKFSRTSPLAAFVVTLLAAPAAQAGYTQTIITSNYFTTGDTNWYAAENGHDLDETTIDTNYVLVPSAPVSRGGHPVLLVFFAGTGATLDSYTAFMQRAANDGYYVIGLAVRNDLSHTTLCSCEKFCMGWLQQQNVTGVDNGFYKQDDPAYNSVDYRLGSLLALLDIPGISTFNQWKASFWDGTIDDLGFGTAPQGDPKWSRIVVAGHSGGGNLATWILKNGSQNGSGYLPIGALTFSAPNPDLNIAQTHSTFVLGNNTTTVNAVDYTDWAQSGTHGTCTANAGLPDWLNGSFSSHLMVYDDSRDLAYTGAWAGHNIPDVVHFLGLSELLFSDGGTPSGRWITRIDNTTGCGTTGNPHHSEPIANCGLDHHGVWNYMLNTALTF